jgi:TonB family protein
MSFVVNVEAERERLTELWPQWQSEVINGLYPLHRLLNGSDYSAVFATECTAQGISTAAVKIVPAERVTLAELSHWRTAADLSHPHLLRLLDAGLCQLGGRQFLFVVMEYAEQTLSQVLLQRALTGDEVQEMLPAALDALAFLHCKNLVQGQLKPANFLVVNDRLKLASDTVRPAGEPRTSVSESSLYDPPEAESDRLLPAGDIWALGMTMVEALTQRLPASNADRSATAYLPPTLAPTLVDAIQRCLSHNPASRPTAVELEAQFKPVPQGSVSVSQGVGDQAPDRTPPPQGPPTPRALAPIIVMVLVLLGAIWVGLRLFKSRPNSHQSIASTVQPSSRQSAGASPAGSRAPQSSLPAPSEVPAPLAGAKSRESEPAPLQGVARSDQRTKPVADASPSAVHEQIPIVPPSALETIHGHVKVAVLVTVDPTGNVIDALMENAGPSAYFARLAKDAARKWKFAPADTQDSRKWLLRFEFTRGGTTGHATLR